MHLTKYLSKSRALVIDCRNKQEAINKTLEALRGHSSIRNHEALVQAIWKREEVLPTGIGLGIGVPHVRSEVVRDPVAVLSILQEGIDYGAIDGVPVRIVLLIAMPDNRHNEYLAYLAKASRLFQDKAYRESLLACEDAAAVWALVEGEKGD